MRKGDVYYFPEPKVTEQKLATLEAAITELQEREKARDATWQPKNDLRKPASSVTGQELAAVAVSQDDRITAATEKAVKKLSSRGQLAHRRAGGVL